ncbi:hypothetical protein BDV37DRAFT_277493 [Aspergillus pseudonomiae]|uniref:Uncharacterized protein n=1 Tax=Aspergillus pseudonomiae TaxID=1506151 RepID=A0A5N7DTR9_9EURO|nr:uncharacterized protein BDV37DRAFT_277493 [Aspergillus pseudonomiae]KAE8409842.1 hypothetical protein BDV37DRAFT_277493 [Aspergillus pseudonomiae]
MGASFTKTLTVTKAINDQASPPTFHIMGGKCRHEHIEELNAADKPCSHCGHSESVHDDASQDILTSTPANDTLEDDFDSRFISLREDTVVQLPNLLEKEKVVHAISATTPILLSETRVQNLKLS